MKYTGNSLFSNNEILRFAVDSQMCVFASQYNTEIFF